MSPTAAPARGFKSATSASTRLQALFNLILLVAPTTFLLSPPYILTPGRVSLILESTLWPNHVPRGNEAAAATRRELLSAHPPAELTPHLFATKADGRSTLQEGGADTPLLTIFCAPKPYLSPPSPDDPQRRALLSWLNLTPPPKIVLFGADESFFVLEQEFPGRISVEPEVDSNFYGVPLFHSMLARAQAAGTELSMIINGDIILLDDLLPAVTRVKMHFQDWILTAARWDVAEGFPFAFEGGKSKSVENAEGSEEGREFRLPLERGSNDRGEFFSRVREFVIRRGTLHTGGGVDFWCWNNSPVPLFSETMPPFSFGRGKYDNWFVHEAVASGLRQVVDASDAVTSVHVAHSYSHVKAAGEVKAGGFWSTRKKSSWELFANIHMAERHGSYTNQKGTAQHAPWRLASCEEPESDYLCLLKRTRPGVCSCEYTPYALSTQINPKPNHNKNRWECGVVSKDRQSEYEIPTDVSPSSVPGLPHTLTQLLETQLTTIGDVSFVILVPFCSSQFIILMNFVCRLRHLGLSQSVLVAALDREAYKSAFLQGLPVFFDPSFERRPCSRFLEDCAASLFEAKIKLLAYVRERGCSVLFSELDVIWLSNPLPSLTSSSQGSIPMLLEGRSDRAPLLPKVVLFRADVVSSELMSSMAENVESYTRKRWSFHKLMCGEVEYENALGGIACAALSQVRIRPLNSTSFLSNYVSSDLGEKELKMYETFLLKHDLIKFDEFKGMCT